MNGARVEWHSVFAQAFKKFVAECYFLDVGQGASQVINLGGGNAIVIDCGPNGHVLCDLLRRKLRITRIAALILSHNHQDHVGGMPAVVRNYRKAIDHIYLLQDMDAKKLQASKTFRFLEEEHTKGNIPAPIPLIQASSNHCLYPSINQDENALKLNLLFPDFFDNVHGQTSQNQNHTCGVLLLECGEKRILFPGDAEIDAWRTIYKKRNEQSVRCDVMAIPHHGGQIVRYRKKDETYDELHEAISSGLEWMYTQAIVSTTTVVSVGTSNSYPDQHPLPPQIDAVRKSGSCVMCTQITKRCVEDVESVRPGVLASQDFPCQSSSSKVATTSGQPKDVACAGTVLVSIGPKDISVYRQAEHQNAVDTRLCCEHETPLCRSASGKAEKDKSDGQNNPGK